MSNISNNDTVNKIKDLIEFFLSKKSPIDFGVLVVDKEVDSDIAISNLNDLDHESPNLQDIKGYLVGFKYNGNSFSGDAELYLDTSFNVTGIFWYEASFDITDKVINRIIDDVRNVSNYKILGVIDDILITLYTYILSECVKNDNLWLLNDCRIKYYKSSNSFDYYIGNYRIVYYPSNKTWYIYDINGPYSHINIDRIGKNASGDFKATISSDSQEIFREYLSEHFDMEALKTKIKGLNFKDSFPIIEKEFEDYDNWIMNLKPNYSEVTKELKKIGDVLLNASEELYKDVD